MTKRNPGDMTPEQAEAEMYRALKAAQTIRRTKLIPALRFALAYTPPADRDAFVEEFLKEAPTPEDREPMRALLAQLIAEMDDGG
jgi:hypothetical protein